MVSARAGLSPSDLDAIADLERRVVAADGGRLKLEWGSLRERSGRDVEDLLWWDDGRLLGFLGIYSHSAPTIELAGMVDPGSRRRGIGTALLAQARRLCRDRAYQTVLLIVPRGSAAGRALALHHGGTLDHSEHALRLPGEPAEVPADPRVRVRAATAADAPVIREILHLGFGWRPADGTAVDPHTLVIERDGAVIGSVRLVHEADEAGVYGFVIHPDHQGRGIGRDVLHRLCRRARAEGARAVGLEVATDNDRALHLYTSLGFTPVTTEDYYALPQ